MVWDIINSEEMLTKVRECDKIWCVKEKRRKDEFSHWQFGYSHDEIVQENDSVNCGCQSVEIEGGENYA